MVYGMMQRHEGSIEIESQSGHGTCIRLSFPVRKATAQDASAPTTLKNKQGRSLNILCIDDEPGVRELLNDCLGHFHHRVTLASTGKQGLELFREARLKGQPYELVITDLGMPGVDGNQVTRTIKSESASTPVIMMTGWGTMMKDDGETAPGVDALIGKPPRMHELNDLLLRLIPQDTRRE
jgi:CheY-like chemotaxis protein